MNFKPVLLTIALGLVPPGCGDKKEEMDFENQSRSGNCGLNVVSDYNSVVFACNSDGKEACSKKISQFLSKYPKVNCKAEVGYGLDKQEIQVNEPKVRRLMVKFS